MSEACSRDPHSEECRAFLLSSCEGLELLRMRAIITTVSNGLKDLSVPRLLVAYTIDKDNDFWRSELEMRGCHPDWDADRAIEQLRLAVLKLRI